MLAAVPEELEKSDGITERTMRHQNPKYLTECKNNKLEIPKYSRKLANTFKKKKLSNFVQHSIFIFNFLFDSYCLGTPFQNF